MSRWNRVDAVARIAPGEVHVYRAVVALSGALEPELSALLSDTEWQRAQRIADASTRVRFLATRAWLRLLLARQLGRDAANIAFTYSPTGKPCLSGAAGADLHFSVSHTDARALFAVARGRSVGVDLERLRPRRRAGRVAERLFDARTRATLRTVSAGEHDRAFLHAWTLHEAFVKATGSALFRTRVPLRLDRWPPESTLRVHDSAGAWTLHGLDVEDGYVGAIAAAGDVARFRLWRLDDALTLQL